MADKQKYVFRLYNIGVPNKYANAYFGKDMSGKTYLGSPYVRRTANIYNEDNYKEPGETIHDTQFDDVRSEQTEDWLVRPYSNIRKFENSNHNFTYDGNLLLPHKGLSVISLADPFFSFYNLDSFGDNFIQKNKDGKYYINKKFIDAMGDRYKGGVDKYLGKFFGISLADIKDDTVIQDSDIKELLDFFSFYEDEQDLIDSINTDILKSSNFSFRDEYTDARNFNAKNAKNLSTYDFGYSKPRPAVEVWDNGTVYVDDELHRGLPYEQLLRRIIKTRGNTNASGLVLASVPESAFYNVKDVIDGKLRAQRDYPEELVVKQLTPLKIFGVHGTQGPANTPKPLTNIGKYKHGGENHINLRHISDLLDNSYAKGRTPEEVNNLSQEIIHRLFGINPTKISDENKKFIFDDLSNWYKGYSDKKKNKHNNIISGIKELGQ